MTKNYFHKDPQSVEDYELRWSSFIGGDSIATSTWTVPSGITKDSDSKTATTTTIWLSGGTSGQVYELVNTITTVAGRTWQDSIWIEALHNSVYTVASKNIERRIRHRVSDDTQPYEYTTEVMNNAIQQAVDWYNDMRPYQKNGTLTTVKDQQLYALPSDALHVIELHYKRQDTEEIYERLADFYPFNFTDVGIESLELIQEELLRAFEEYAHYFWLETTYRTSYQAGRYVILYPPPTTSGDTVHYVYAREHEATDNDFPTIPKEHSKHIVDLAILSLDRRELKAYQRGPARYREGQTEVDYRQTITDLKRDTQNEWQRLKDALGGSVASQ